MIVQSDRPAGPPRRYRLSTDQYERLAAVGVIPPDTRVELIDGELIEMPPMNPPHSAVVMRLDALWQRIAGQERAIRTSMPLKIDWDGEPWPDLVVLSSPIDEYATRHPLAAEALLVIEVSDTTLDDDQKIKGPKYARAGVGEYWVVDINGDRVWVYTEPGASGYGFRHAYHRGESASPLAFPDVPIAVEAILGPPR